MLLRVALLLACLAAPAAAGDDPGSWTIEGEPPTAPASWMPGLWLTVGDRVTPMLRDVLGRHAAIHATNTPRLVVSLDRVLPAGAKAPELDWKHATLERPGAAPLVLLDDPAAWKDQPAGVQTRGNADATVVSVCLPFAHPDGPLERLTLSIPVLDEAPVVVHFATWEAVLKDAEKELADWRAHCVASAAISAIPPYLDCAAYRGLRARGDRLVAALLLRELARGDGEGSLPRFVILHALADTEWGKTQRVPSSGDEAAAARVLRRWRDLGHPSVPGASPR